MARIESGSAFHVCSEVPKRPETMLGASYFGHFACSVDLRPKWCETRKSVVPLVNPQGGIEIRVIIQYAG